MISCDGETQWTHHHMLVQIHFDHYLHQHMVMGPLCFTITWYHLLCFPTQIHFKVCWWITQLHRWVALMIIWMLQHVTKKWGKMELLPLFCTLPNVSISIKRKIVTATLIFETRLKSLYSRLGFNVIKNFATYPHFKEAHERFHYESLKSKLLQKQTIGLQCYLNIPRVVTIIHYNQIDLNENKDVFKELNEVLPSDD